MRVELRKGRRSVRRLLTPEEVELLMFMLATALAGCDPERAPAVAKQAVLRVRDYLFKVQHG